MAFALNLPGRRRDVPHYAGSDRGAGSAHRHAAATLLWGEGATRAASQRRAVGSSDWGSPVV